MGKEMRLGRARYYCCPGHDGFNSHYIKRKRTAKRKAEEANWRKEWTE